MFVPAASAWLPKSPSRRMVRAMEVITTERLEAIVAARLDDERAEQLLSLVRPSLRLSFGRETPSPQGHASVASLSPTSTGRSGRGIR